MVFLVWYLGVPTTFSGGFWSQQQGGETSIFFWNVHPDPRGRSPGWLFLFKWVGSTTNYPWTPKPWKMKVLGPPIWVISPKNEGFGFPWLFEKKTSKHFGGKHMLQIQFPVSHGGIRGTGIWGIHKISVDLFGKGSFPWNFICFWHLQNRPLGSSEIPLGNHHFQVPYFFDRECRYS